MCLGSESHYTGVKSWENNLLTTTFTVNAEVDKYLAYQEAQCKWKKQKLKLALHVPKPKLEHSSGNAAKSLQQSARKLASN